jgi:hypothetical protein
MVGGYNTDLQPEDNSTLAQRKALFGLMAALQEQFLISGENLKRREELIPDISSTVLKWRERDQGGI